MKGSMNGSIARLVRDRGFGFILGADGIEYFFHRSSCAPDSSFDSLTEGEAVKFEDGGGAKGPRAADVARA